MSLSKLGARLRFVLDVPHPPPPLPAPTSFLGPLLTRIRGVITGKMGCGSTALIFCWPYAPRKEVSYRCRGQGKGSGSRDTTLPVTSFA